MIVLVICIIFALKCAFFKLIGVFKGTNAENEGHIAQKTLRKLKYFSFLIGIYNRKATKTHLELLKFRLKTIIVSNIFIDLLLFLKVF